MKAARAPAERAVPRIPPRGRVLRTLIDTDAKAEIDDLYAIALAMLSPERFRIEGFVGSNFMNDPDGGMESAARSAREIETVMAKAGLAGRWPVKVGGHPLQYPGVPSPSEGADFIIERAMAADPDDPLWIIGLGSSTNMASAFLREPRIAERVVVFWHFRTQWPRFCYNFNVFGDVRAARVLFHSSLPFVLFDTGTHLTAPMEETERRVRPHGDLGLYLHDYRLNNPHFQSPAKGFFDLGDIAALLDPAVACWEQTPCPEVDWDLSYRFTGKMGSILRCYHVDREAAFALLYRKLEEHAGR
jgi:hypothetical protein